MSLFVSIIGIDGSGKSTVTSALADLAAAEMGLTAAAIGDDCRCKTPEEDLLLPGFAPDGESLAARLDRFFRRSAKGATNSPRFYPPLKLAQLPMQERAARAIETRYHPDVIFCDGSLILSSAGRAANYLKTDHAAVPADPVPYIAALYDHVLDGAPLPPAMASDIHGLRLMRRLRGLDRRLNLGVMELPDALIFLDLAPETALARRIASGGKLDRHENLPDLTQAQAMYRGVVEFFRRRRGDARTAVIRADGLSVGETLQAVLTFVRTLPLGRDQREHGAVRERLGTTDADLSKKTSVFGKVLTYRYLARYALPNLGRGSAQEMTFPLSPLGQLFLKEGYSAGVMKVIYVQESHRYGWLDRVFLSYPLHRAVYDRLQILKPMVEQELRRRLLALTPTGTLRVLTAPSGYAFDLFQPLAHLAHSGQVGLGQLRVLASDLDPDGGIERELTQAALGAGFGFEFARGDLTSPAMGERFQRSGPYDLVLFVGLSSWISKAHLLRHLQLIREHLLAPDGALVTDCFTPDAYALSGKYVGYKANYYAPRDFTSLLAYCGFDPAGTTWATGRDRINHVCLARR